MVNAIGFDHHHGLLPTEQSRLDSHSHWRTCDLEYLSEYRRCSHVQKERIMPGSPIILEADLGRRAER